MRIGLFLGNSRRIGAAQTLVVTLGKALASQGHQVFGLQTSTLLRTKGQLQELQIERVPLISPVLKVSGAGPNTINERVNLRKLSRSRREFWYRLLSGMSISQLISELDLDILVVSYSSNVLTLLPYWPRKRTLLAINPIGFGIDPSRGGLTDTFRYQKAIFSYPYWDLHFTSTLFEYEQYRKVYASLGIDDSKLYYLPHAYDDTAFSPAPPHEIGLRTRSRDELRLIYPVNVYPRKNIELALEILAELNKSVRSSLTVTGRIWDRAYHRSLLELAKRHNVQDKVAFANGLERPDLVRQLQCADVTVFTSHQETFGLGIVESLGCGVPVVGPGWIKATAEILNDAVGGYVSPKKATEMAAIILQVHASHEAPHEIAEAAIASFGSSHIANRFVQFTSKVLQERAETEGILNDIEWRSCYEGPSVTS